MLSSLAGWGKSPFRPQIVIPAEAGIQSFQAILDSGFRRSDGESEFFRILLGFLKPLLTFSNF